MYETVARGQEIAFGKIRGALCHEGGEGLGRLGRGDTGAEQVQFFADAVSEFRFAAAHEVFGLADRLGR